MRNGTSGDPNRYDLYSLFCADTNGFVANELSYGGYGAGYALPTSLPNCNSGPPSSGWQYRIDHTYEAGALKTSRYRDPATGAQMPFYSYRADIDSHTGLASNSYDVSAYRTKYTYDDLGRPLTIEPRGPASGSDCSEAAAKTSYSYPNAGGTSGARVEITIENPSGCGSSTEFGFRQYVFDGFGRAKIERYRRSGGNLARRETRYNALGWKTQVSEWGPDTTPSNWTYFLNFDAFGRATKIRPPDGSSHDVNLTYTGVRKLDRQVKVALSLGGGETYETTTETYDRYGRLAKVQEPTDGIATTTYAYDVGGRLASVSQQSGLTTQLRSFDYDNLGFLESESHPERNTVTYKAYDARGHLRVLWDGSSSRELDFTYDGAERRTRVDTPTYNFAQWIYETNAGSPELGKLKTAIRQNHLGLPPGNYEVHETYTYGDFGRRVTHRTTQFVVNDVNQERIEQGWRYDRAGEVTEMTYPNCYEGQCPSTGTGSGTIAPTYSEGFLTAVPGWASSITYHPNRMVNQVMHSNGVTDTIANDPNGMRRPLSIATSGVAGGANFATGNYAYDGAGNIKSMGSDPFAYDTVSRLKSSQLTVGGVGRSQSYDFDHFGNITRVTTDGTYRETPTDPATNRLISATYGAVGNLLNWNGASYTYDYLGRMTHYVNGSQEVYYVYDADEERVAYLQKYCDVTHCNLALRLTLRDLGGNLLSLVSMPSGVVTDTRPTGSGPVGTTSPPGVTEYVYRGSLLLGRRGLASPTALDHYHLDHLGSPRVITGPSGISSETHEYFPFGEEATLPGTERMKFTGHERDNMTTASAADDIDYLHARYYVALVGRFTSPDPARGGTKAPQSWNRYSYTRNRPLNFVDPTGAFLEEIFQSLKNWISAKLDAAFPPKDPEPMQNIEVLESEIGPTKDQFDQTAIERKTQEALNDFAANASTAVTIAGAVAATEGAGRLADEVASSASSAIRLRRSLASAQQMGEEGTVIAGTGSRVALRNAEKLAAEYGGKATDWVKKTSTSYRGSDGVAIETHWYENVATGERVLRKTKIYN